MTEPTRSLEERDPAAIARAYRIVAQQLYPVSTVVETLNIDDPETQATVAALIVMAAEWARGLAPDVSTSDNAAAIFAASARLDVISLQRRERERSAAKVIPLRPFVLPESAS